jgi:hypothetical protein
MGFTEKLEDRISKSFMKSLQSFRVKLAGAADASYPRSLVIQQIKQTAMSMYTASELICKDVCDVADDSPLILLCFSIGLQALFQEALRILGIPVFSEDLDRIVGDVVADLKATGATNVQFRDVDIESHVDSVTAVFGLNVVPETAPAGSVSPQRATSPEKPRISISVNREGSATENVEPENMRDALRKSIEERQAERRSLSPEPRQHSVSPPRHMSPMEKTEAMIVDALAAEVPEIEPLTREERATIQMVKTARKMTPPRQVSPRRSSAAGDEMFTKMLKALRNVTTSNYDPRTFKKAQLAVREVTHELWLAVDVLRETRINQRFSQSQLI